MKARLGALERKLGRNLVTVIIMRYYSEGEPDRPDYAYTQADLERIEDAEREAALTGKQQFVFLTDDGEQNAL